MVDSLDAVRTPAPEQAGRDSAAAKLRSFHTAPRKLNIVVITLSGSGLQSGVFLWPDRIDYSMMFPRTLTAVSGDPLAQFSK